MEKYSEERTIQSQVKLAATLTRPVHKSSTYPAVVIIGGTGKLNRDGNGFGFKMNIYKNLAENLTELGFVTLRYDKQGIGKSEGKANVVGVEDLIDDVVECVKYLKELPFVDSDKIILVGHSEGCILSTLSAEVISVAGLILISGAGVSMKTSMEEQGRFLLDEVSEIKGIKGKLLRFLLSEKSVVEKQQKLFERISKSTKDTVRIQLMNFPAKWLREHLAYSNQDLINKLNHQTIPILAVTGNKDVQTDYRNLNALSELDSEYIVTSVIEDMDHMLKRFCGKVSVLDVKKQYKAELNQPMHQELVHVIKEWAQRSKFI
ncbi:MAG: alpha/beta hydrolase [Clostridiales bacterium]|nr:alpha/beta hydrolase [Clostridiales bacterium]